MKISGKLEWRDYLEAQFLHLRPARWVRCISYFVLAIVSLFFGASIVLSIIDNRNPAIATGYALPLVIILGIFLPYRKVLVPRRVREIFTHQKELAAPFEIEITPAGLNASNQYGASNHPWGNFRKWKENKNILLLYHSDVLFTIIPKRFCTDAQIATIHGDLLEYQVADASHFSRLSWISVAVYGPLMILIVVGFFFGFSRGGR